MGAPYVGAGRGEGAVYIFRGSRAGVREQPDQVTRGVTRAEGGGGRDYPAGIF